MRPRIYRPQKVNVQEVITKEKKHNKLFFQFKIKPIMDEKKVNYKEAKNYYINDKSIIESDNIWKKIKREVQLIQ